jgi:hypothetical protein
VLKFDPAGGQTWRSGRLLLASLALVSLALLGGVCVPADYTGPDPDPEPAPVEATPPIISVTLNGIPEDTNQLLVVPPSGFVINVDWEATDAPIDLDSFSAIVAVWDGSLQILGDSFSMDENGAWLILPEPRALPEGSHTVYAGIRDVDGTYTQTEYSFAVRDFNDGVRPIGSGQEIWLDFDADRDATPGPDFEGDLETLGLASAGAPASVNVFVHDWVVSEILERVRSAYEDSNPAALAVPDPIAVGFSDQDLGLPQTTRICIGGEDPTGGITLGNVQLDPDNAQRSTVECGTIPPTGVFPREILMYAGQAEFQSTIDPLRPAAGGVPVGTHPADAVVLDPAFDPTAPGIPSSYLDRHLQVRTAVEAFAAALGTVIAHETGHALGLVPEGAPGVGLYGGASGGAYAHNVMPDGSLPDQTWLMNQGGQFDFAELAAMSGEPPAEFRPLNHAYLRDRVVLAAEVTALLPPPILESVDPVVVTQSLQTLHLYGVDFAATPSVTLSNDTFVYQAIGETLVSPGEATAAIVKGQLAPGVYDVTLMNPDGQGSQIPDAVTIE